jgi:hypothetical protein
MYADVCGLKNLISLIGGNSWAKFKLLLIDFFLVLDLFRNFLCWLPQ